MLIVLPDRFEFAETWFGVLRAGAVFAMVNPLLKREQFADYLAYTQGARRASTHADVAARDRAGGRARRARCETVLRRRRATRGGFTPYEEALAAEDPGSAARRDRAAPAPTTSPAGSSPRARPARPRPASTRTPTSPTTPRPTRCRSPATARATCASRCPSSSSATRPGTNLMFPFRVGASVDPVRRARDGRRALRPDRAPPADVPDQRADDDQQHAALASACASADLSSLRVCALRRRGAAAEALRGVEGAHRRRDPRRHRLGGDVPHLHLEPPRRREARQPRADRAGLRGARSSAPTGARVPDGEPGRLRVRGGSTALCYWADKAKSRETFQGEWCTTADIFRRDARGLLLLRGARRRPAQGLRHLGLAARDRERAARAPRRGRGLRRRARGRASSWSSRYAFVVLDAGRDPGRATTARGRSRRTSSAQLAPYKYPRWFEWRASLPKNDRGKVARGELKAELARR